MGPMFGLLQNQLPPQTDAVMPKKPSILDRLLGRLFPTAQYTGLLDPASQQGLQQQATRQLAANLLVAGGRSAQNRGTLANIGAAIGGVDTNALADRALALQAVRRKQASDEAIRGVTSELGAGSAYEQISSLLPKLTALGPEGIKAAAALSSVADALKPQGRASREPMRIADVRDNVIGSPTHGLVGTVLLDPDTHERVGFIPQVQASDQAPKVTAQQRGKYGEQAEFGTAALAAWRPVEQIRNRNPGVEAEVGKIVSSPSFVQAIPGFHSADDAVLALRKAGASADAQQYLRAKIGWLAQIERTRYTGARGITGVLLKQFYQEFMPGLDELSNTQMRQNEIQAMLSAQGNAGYDEHPEYWNRAAKRHGVSGIDLEKILSGGSLDDRLTEIQDRYK